MIPWWGWLLISLSSLTALYFLGVFVFYVIVLKFLKGWLR